MPGNFSPLAGQLYNAPTTATTYQPGFTEEGAAARGIAPTTVPPELRFEGESFAQSWVQHAQAAAQVLPALAGPVGVVAVALGAQGRAEAQEQALANAEQAKEARAQWATGFRDFGMTLAGQQATFGRQLAELRATFGGNSPTYFQNPSPISNRSIWPTFRFPNSGGVSRLTQALRRGRRILTLEDL